MSCLAGAFCDVEAVADKRSVHLATFALVPPTFNAASFFEKSCVSTRDSRQRKKEQNRSGWLVFGLDRVARKTKHGLLRQTASKNIWNRETRRNSMQ
jgi:hypothetical protein